MKLGVHLAETTQLDPGVDLGCGDRGMAQHLLYDPQIRSAREQVGREAVAQSVRTDVRLQSGGPGMPLDDPPQADPR